MIFLEAWNHTTLGTYFLGLRQPWMDDGSDLGALSYVLQYYVRRLLLCPHPPLLAARPRPVNTEYCPLHLIVTLSLHDNEVYSTDVASNPPYAPHSLWTAVLH